MVISLKPWRYHVALEEPQFLESEEGSWTGAKYFTAHGAMGQFVSRK